MMKRSNPGMEAIDVTARFDSQGNVHPLEFTWQGNSYAVIAEGRRWQDGEGEHMLVMAPGDVVYELVFVPAVRRWYMGNYGFERRARA